VFGAPVHNAAEIEAAINTLAREPNGGLIAFPTAAVVVHRDKIIALVAQYCLPAVYYFRYFVAEGGLASYGVDVVEQFRGAASYVDRNLRGANPADLPVQFADKYELVINEDRQGAWARPPNLTARAYRRGDRVRMLFCCTA
jgi:putative ABC transport system substrate-binding protein